MIVVLLGTQKQSFKRLIDMVETLVIKRNITEEIIIQSGNTKYKSNISNIIIKPFLEEYENILENSNLVICHSGVGSIMDAIKYNKKIIVVPRLSENNEHVDDHQEEISKEFSSKSYVLECNTKEELMYIYDNILDDFKPKKYKSNNEKFNKSLNRLLEDII